MFTHAGTRKDGIWANLETHSVCTGVDRVTVTVNSQETVHSRYSHRAKVRSRIKHTQTVKYPSKVSKGMTTHHHRSTQLSKPDLDLLHQHHFVNEIDRARLEQMLPLATLPLCALSDSLRHVTRSMRVVAASLCQYDRVITAHSLSDLQAFVHDASFFSPTDVDRKKRSLCTSWESTTPYEPLRS